MKTKKQAKDTKRKKLMDLPARKEHETRVKGGFGPVDGVKATGPLPFGPIDSVK